MIRSLYQSEKIFLCLIICTVMYGCSITGKIVDRNKFETNVEKMRLEEYPNLKVYYGGGVREIPLKMVTSIKIEPLHTYFFENELYYSAEINLKDGTEIVRSDENTQNSNYAYISVRNTIFGKSTKGIYRIGLENISNLEIQ